MRNFDDFFIDVHPATYGMEKIDGIVIFHKNTRFLEYFKAGIVDIGNFIVGQYFEINTFQMKFTATNGTIHFFLLSYGEWFFKRFAVWLLLFSRQS